MGVLGNGKSRSPEAKKTPNPWLRHRRSRQSPSSALGIRAHPELRSGPQLGIQDLGSGVDGEGEGLGWGDFRKSGCSERPQGVSGEQRAYWSREDFEKLLY